MTLADVRLTIPGVGRAMRVSRAEIFDPTAFADTPIMVIARPRPVIAYDVTALAEAFGARWPAVEATFAAVEKSTVHAELRAIAERDALPAEAIGPLAEAELGMIEGEPLSLATLVLILLQARIRAIVEEAGVSEAT